MGLLSSLLGVIGFGIGLPIGLFIGFYLFVYSESEDVEVIMCVCFMLFLVSTVALDE